MWINLLNDINSRLQSKNNILIGITTTMFRDLDYT